MPTRVIADLHRRQEFARILGERERGLRAPVTLLHHLTSSGLLAETIAISDNAKKALIKSRMKMTRSSNIVSGSPLKNRRPRDCPLPR